ncbi:unnamed protein product [Amoebophrya sp. A25]|nr:unnamed protein product [Amoebophrya sp. A25]|eukprot:GSA25T00007478001.1
MGNLFSYCTKPLRDGILSPGPSNSHFLDTWLVKVAQHEDLKPINFQSGRVWKDFNMGKTGLGPESRGMVTCVDSWWPVLTWPKFRGIVARVQVKSAQLCSDEVVAETEREVTLHPFAIKYSHGKHSEPSGPRWREVDTGDPELKLVCKKGNGTQGRLYVKSTKKGDRRERAIEGPDAKAAAASFPQETVPTGAAASFAQETALPLHGVDVGSGASDDGAGALNVADDVSPAQQQPSSSTGTEASLLQEVATAFGGDLDPETITDAAEMAAMASKQSDASSKAAVAEHVPLLPHMSTAGIFVVCSAVLMLLFLLGRRVRNSCRAQRCAADAEGNGPTQQRQAVADKGVEEYGALRSSF